MSFSGNVKEELLAHIGSARHCRIAELAAILAFEGEIYRNSSGELNLMKLFRKLKNQSLK